MRNSFFVWCDLWLKLIFLYTIIAKLNLNSTQLKIRLRLALFPFDPITWDSSFWDYFKAILRLLKAYSASTQGGKLILNSTLTHFKLTELGTTQLKLFHDVMWQCHFVCNQFCSTYFFAMVSVLWILLSDCQSSAWSDLCNNS